MNGDDKREIQDFMIRAESLTYKDHARLEEFLEKLKELIRRMFADESAYLNDVLKIRFKPASFFSTEMDYLKSFLQGQQEILKILKRMLDDPLWKMKDEEIHREEKAPAFKSSDSEQESSPPEDKTKPPSPDPQKLLEIRESLSHTIDLFKHTVLNSLTPAAQANRSGSLSDQLHPEIMDMPHPLDPPLEDTLFMEHFTAAFKETEPVHKQPVKAKTDPLTSKKKIFLLAGHDRESNGLVDNFLSKLNISIHRSKEWPYGEQAIMEQFRGEGPFDGAVVILSADCFIYPRERSPLDARLTGNQHLSFQLGFLVGTLGRQKVLVLYKEQPNFLPPTNYFEILYIPLDAFQHWQKELMDRLRIAAPIRQEK